MWQITGVNCFRCLYDRSTSNQAHASVVKCVLEDYSIKWIMLQCFIKCLSGFKVLGID